MEITYRQEGDYLIPNLTLPKQPKRTYTKWGEIRRTYLKNHCPVQYNLLVIKAELTAHLNEIDEQAWSMWETIMEQLERQSVPPPQGTMQWVQWQNRLRAIADEQVLHDIIYN
ncbi:MAG: TnpV protein [Oscillospiraceae bacterium]|nr:TnpV protein [Oscillospiraceae bacterium]